MSDLRIACTLGACLAAGASVAAADPLDLYIGAGAGYSTVPSASLQPDEVDRHPNGWKVFAGWRPIQVFGAELAYVDLGSKDSTQINGLAVISEHASGNALAAFAVGYLPQPLPYLDFYGKLGVARLESNLKEVISANAGVCPPGNVCDIPGPTVLGGGATHGSFAYGAGVQLGFGAPMLRLEYQGFSASGGDLSLLSLDIAFNF